MKKEGVVLSGSLSPLFYTKEWGGTNRYAADVKCVRGGRTSKYHDSFILIYHLVIPWLCYGNGWGGDWKRGGGAKSYKTQYIHTQWQVM
jgi:hypothetical protein